MRRYRDSIGVVFGLWAAVAIAGCGGDDPLPPAAVHRQVADNLGDIVGSLGLWAADTAQDLQDPPLASAIALLQQVTGVDTPIAQAIGQVPAQLAALDSALLASKIPDAVNTQIFADARYRGDSNYDVSPSALCALIAPAHADTCATLVGKLDVHLHTTALAQPTGNDPEFDEGFVVGVQIGPAHVEALTLTLGALRVPLGELNTSLTAVLNLDELQHALAGIPDLPPTQLSGQLTVRLGGSAVGANLLGQVDRALALAIAGASGDLAGHDAFSLTADVGLFNFDLDAAFDNTLIFSNFDLGALAVELPAGADGKRHGFAMPGLSGLASLHTAPDFPIEITGLSLAGPLTITRDGATARSFDATPDAGSMLSLVVKSDPVSFSATPKLDLRITTDHAVLGDTPAPAFDISEILIDDTVTATVAANRVEVTAGTFRIDTVPTGHGFTATAGQCVTSTDTTAVQWRVGACPVTP